MALFKSTALLSLGIAASLFASGAMAMMGCEVAPGQSVTLPDVQMEFEQAGNSLTFFDAGNPKSNTVTYSCSSDHICSFDHGNQSWNNINYAMGSEQGQTDATVGEGWIRTQPNIYTFSITGQNKAHEFFIVKYNCPITK